jgi:hypothetical protein
MRPLGGRRRGSGQIPATGGAGVRGEGGGGLKAHLGVDFCARRGREGGRRWGALVVSGTGRRGWPSRRG